jgi:hypothetical protein
MRQTAQWPDEGQLDEIRASDALMLHPNLVVFVCLAYVAILFGVAFAGDRRARRDPAGWLSSPLVYTLSISIYCTSWTFYGAVGSAVTGGMEFIAIYLGPTIVFAGWWVFLRKLVTVGRVHHTTSIADPDFCPFWQESGARRDHHPDGARCNRALHRAATESAHRQLPGGHFP